LNEASARRRSIGSKIRLSGNADIKHAALEWFRVGIAKSRANFLSEGQQTRIALAWLLGSWCNGISWVRAVFPVLEEDVHRIGNEAVAKALWTVFFNAEVAAPVAINVDILATKLQGDITNERHGNSHCATRNLPSNTIGIGTTRSRKSNPVASRRILVVEATLNTELIGYLSHVEAVIDTDGGNTLNSPLPLRLKVGVGTHLNMVGAASEDTGATDLFTLSPLSRSADSIPVVDVHVRITPRVAAHVVGSLSEAVGSGDELGTDPSRGARNRGNSNCSVTVALIEGEPEDELVLFGSLEWGAAGEVLDLRNGTSSVPNNEVIDQAIDVTAQLKLVFTTVSNADLVVVCGQGVAVDVESSTACRHHKGNAVPSVCLETANLSGGGSSNTNELKVTTVGDSNIESSLGGTVGALN